MEPEFRSSLNRLVRAILRYLGRDTKQKIIQSWTRNKPKDANETVNRLASTPSEVMSNYTKRRLHPDIDDPDLEDTLVQQEEAQRMQNQRDQFADEPEV